MDDSHDYDEDNDDGDRLILRHGWPGPAIIDDEDGDNDDYEDDNDDNDDGDHLMEARVARSSK